MQQGVTTASLVKSSPQKYAHADTECVHADRASRGPAQAKASLAAAGNECEFPLFARLFSAWRCSCVLEPYRSQHAPPG